MEHKNNIYGIKIVDISEIPEGTSLSDYLAKMTAYDKKFSPYLQQPMTEKLVLLKEDILDYINAVMLLYEAGGDVSDWECFLGRKIFTANEKLS